MVEVLCAVDVGTGSARAGIFDRNGHLLARASEAVTRVRPAGGGAAQDSENIWRAVCGAVRSAVARATIEPARIAAIGFDATCSLVVRDAAGDPLSVSVGGPANLDTICWMDHRAIREAGECTATGHPVLEFLGGAMSPEMQTPKLMWLKRHHPATWKRAARILDLADFLTWKATGSASRSMSTVTAKWTYLGHAGGWQHDFFDAVGLDNLSERAGLDAGIVPPGGVIGSLSQRAAGELGLSTQCVVAAGLIDAFAGTLGAIGARVGEEVDRHLALIAGTSSCVVAIAPAPRPAKGLWGPYQGVAMPDYWLSEGGQSATGALLDHVIAQFGCGLTPDQSTHNRIALRIGELRACERDDFASDLHVLPDFHGNRTPYGDPASAGVISGLSLDNSFDGLCRLYWRSCVAIALGVRHILEHMNASGFRIDTLHLTGGHSRSPLLAGLYADVTGCRIRVAAGTDAMLLGSAMNAAVAAGLFGDLPAAAAAMSQDIGVVVEPRSSDLYERDFRIFKRLREQRIELLAMT